MVDLTSLEAFAASFDVDHAEAFAALGLKPETPKSMRASVSELARRGYLGFVRLARGDRKNDAVLRLAPDQPLAGCSVAVALGDSAEAITVAPDLRRFVAGWMAHIDFADPKRKPFKAALEDLAHLADEFGGARFLKQVIDAVPEARKQAQWKPRRGALWAALAEDPTCEILAAAFCHRLSEVKPVLMKLSAEARATLIAKRLSVCFAQIRGTDDDVAGEAWDLVAANNLVDPTFTGTGYGPWPKLYEADAMGNAVAWLQEHAAEPTPDLADVWRAAQRRQADAGYDGEAHLRAAVMLKSSHPRLALEQAISAAAYEARSRGKASDSPLELALEIAADQAWPQLHQCLIWASA